MKNKKYFPKQEDQQETHIRKEFLLVPAQILQIEKLKGF